MSKSKHYTRPFDENDFARAWKWRDLPLAQQIIREAFFDLTPEEEKLAINWCAKNRHNWQEIVDLIKGSAKKMTYLVPEGYDIPQEEFIFRENSQFVTRTTEDLFYDKRVIVFSLPGAFTPTCSHYQLPGFEEKYDEFKELGIDEIYCVSVNDAFVMNAWAKDQGIKKVKMLPDGNGYFTRQMGMLVKKTNLGFSSRSWRYAMVVYDGQVEKLFVESGMRDNAETDPYQETTPEIVLEYAKTSAKDEVTA